MTAEQGSRRQAFCRSHRQGRETVEFSVKGPITVSLDEEQVSVPGCSIIDLLFPNPSQVGELVFRNYYTAWVTVMLKFCSSPEIFSTGNAVGGNNKDDLGTWTIGISQRILMPNPHLEPGSHDMFSIPASESQQEWSNLLAMRLVLRQPSPMWRTFHVEELNVYRDLPRRGPRSLQKSFSNNSPIHCQEVSLISVVQCQTIESLKWLSSAEQREQKEQKEGQLQLKDPHVNRAYEFFNLPQV